MSERYFGEGGKKGDASPTQFELVFTRYTEENQVIQATVEGRGRRLAAANEFVLARQLNDACEVIAGEVVAGYRTTQRIGSLIENAVQEQ